MITTMYGVKSYTGLQDGISASQPDFSFDLSYGYYKGFILLVEDGTTWVCVSSGSNAAVWTQDLSKDVCIESSIENLTAMLPIYLNNRFIKDIHYSDTISMSGDTLEDSSKEMDFFVGDSILIDGSRRNDREYNILTASETTLTVSPDFKQDEAEGASIAVYYIDWPVTIVNIANRMADYDVNHRPEGPGLASENVGSYSSTKELVDVMGLAYPASVIAGIMVFKSPNVV